MQPDAANCAVVRRSHLFRALVQADFDNLMQTARLYPLQEGAYLFQQGQAFCEIYICTEGLLKLFRLTPNGDEKIMDIIHAGDSFAEAVLFMGSRQYPVNAVALKPAVVVGIQAAQYEHLLRASVDVCFNLMEQMSRRMHWLLNEVDRLTLHNATFRLVWWLLEAYEQSGTSRITLHMPKQALASRLSIQPETFSRILKRLIEQQLLAVQENSIDLLDVATLQELVRLET